MQAATRIEIHRIFFLWGLSLSHFQMFQKMVADGVTFLLKHRAIVHRTLLNANKDVLWGGFKIPALKTLENLENIQENVFSVVLIPDWKFLCRYFSGSAQKRKDILISQKPSQMCAFFSYVTGLQSKIPCFNKNRPQQKCFLWVLSRNSLNEGILW